MKPKAKKSLQNITPYVPGKPIDEVKRELRLKSVVKLASNENPYPPPANVLNAIRKAAGDINRYPDGGCFHLRSELAKCLKVKPNQIIFGNGSDEVIVFAVRTFVGAGDEVVIAQPSFLIYDIASRVEGARIKSVPLKDFRYDLASMKKAVTKRTKIIFLGNPDNPSGMYFTEKEIKTFMRGLRGDILVFIDEAYYEYVDQKDYVDSIKLLRQYPNLIVTRTFSKMYGLAALRIGYGVASESIIDAMNRVREPFNVTTLSQVAALACLKNKKHFKQVAAEVKKQRQWVVAQIEALGLKSVKSFTNFILIKVPSDSTKISQALLKKGVIIRDMAGWGMKGFIRVSIGTARENKILIKALRDVVGS